MIQSVSVAVVEVAIAAAIAARQCEPVDRSRLERLAALHRLTVTPGNGAMLIDYLRTTRRWRAGGFVAGLAVYLLINATSGGLGFGIDSGYPFMGWYAGAMIAEIALRRPPSGVHRPPLLISWPALILSVLSLAGCSIVLAVAVHGGTLRAALLLAVAVTLLSGLLQLRLQRLRISATEDDIVRAGLAIRSRSLHVLAAGSPVFLGTAVAKAASPAGFNQVGLTADISSVLYFALAMLAWLIATRPRPVPLDMEHEASVVPHAPGDLRSDPH